MILADKRESPVDGPAAIRDWIKGRKYPGEPDDFQTMKLQNNNPFLRNKQKEFEKQ
jgi:hypothetical protein